MANNQAAFDAIVAQIWDNTAPATVNLNYAGITAADCIPLVSALRNNTSVQTLNLFSNSFGDIGAQALATALQTNIMQWLDLQGNLIGDIGAQALAAALQVNTALAFLGLSSNSIGDSGAQALAAALQVNTKLQYLDISFNSIGDSGFLALKNALQVNYLLLGISFWSNRVNQYQAEMTALLARNNQCIAQAPTYLQCPILLLNPLPIQNGARLTLGSRYLRLTNIQRTATLFGDFIVSQVTHGQFLDSTMQPISQFDQAQVSSSTVYFQHDGSGIAPSFNISAIYQAFSTWPIPSKINFTNSSLPTTVAPPTTAASTSLFTTLAQTASSLTSSVSSLFTSTPVATTSTPTLSTPVPTSVQVTTVPASLPTTQTTVTSPLIHHQIN